MSTNKQIVTLLRQNKAETVSALNAVGQTTVTVASRASEFAKRIKWAGGLLDICVATVDGNGREWFFTQEEWEALTAANRSLFTMYGLRVRAYSHSFVIGIRDLTSGNTTTFKWGPAVDNPYQNNFTTGNALADFGGTTNTAAVARYIEANPGSSFPAYAACNNYQAYSGDEHDWHVPGMGTMFAIMKCRRAIFSAITYFFGSDYLPVQGSNENFYLSSTEINATQMCGISLGLGYDNALTKTTAYLVRPVCQEV